MTLKIGKIFEPKSPACACMIWMHGLGAQSDDMEMLLEALRLNDLPLRHVLLDAPIRPVTINDHHQMPAWYDILGDKVTDREDVTGILASETAIGEIIAQQMTTGIAATDIYVAGFSQGGTMALQVGLRYPQPLGGIICLSGYLPLATTLNRTLPTHNLATAIFFAAGQFDPIVHFEWSLASKMHLQHGGCTQLSWQVYPMEHVICAEELADLAKWVRGRLSR